MYDEELKYLKWKCNECGWIMISPVIPDKCPKCLEIFVNEKGEILKKEND